MGQLTLLLAIHNHQPDGNFGHVFEQAYADPKTRDALVAAKQEGLRNKVSATPTLFIDGRPYQYELNAAAVIDVLEEAYEAAKAKK